MINLNESYFEYWSKLWIGDYITFCIKCLRTVVALMMIKKKKVCVFFFWKHRIHLIHAFNQNRGPSIWQSLWSLIFDIISENVYVRCGQILFFSLHFLLFLLFQNNKKRIKKKTMHKICKVSMHNNMGRWVIDGESAKVIFVYRTVTL